ncbi:hypothetical protein JB92DRAFT_3124842 [Gautieria morchelliformis]|nr:hypothetical protein JB92DRAFT_3124842 [Gautieria morchelliformis]
MSSDSYSDFVQGTSDELTYNYVLVVAFTVILYDTLLTLDNEVEFIWQSNFRFVSLLYVTARYFAILDLLCNVVENNVDLSARFLGRACNDMVFFSDTIGDISVIAIQGLLIARTYVMYQSWRFLAVLVLLLIGSNIPAILVTINDSCFSGITTNVTSTLNMGEISFYLNMTSKPILLVAFTVGDFTNLIFDTAIVSVTLYRIWNLPTVLRNMWLRQPLSITGLLVQHEVGRYMSVSCASIQERISTFEPSSLIALLDIVNVTLNRSLRSTLVGIDLGLGMALSTIIVCRFLLGIRRLHAHPNWTSNFHGSLPIGNFMAATCQANDANSDELDNDFVMESFFAILGSHLEESAAPTPLPGSETINLEEFPSSVGVSAE